MEQIRFLEQKQLETFLPRKIAMAKVRDLAHQILRLSRSEGGSGGGGGGGGAGPMDKEKLAAITLEWKRFLTTELRPPSDSAWDFVDPVKSGPKGEEAVFVERSAEPTPIEYQDVLTKGYAVGRSVRLKKRLTGFCDKSVSTHKSRRDVNPGAIGTIAEIPKDESKRVWAAFIVQCGKQSGSKSSKKDV